MESFYSSCKAWLGDKTEYSVPRITLREFQHILEGNVIEEKMALFMNKHQGATLEILGVMIWASTQSKNLSLYMNSSNCLEFRHHTHSKV